MHNPNRDRWLRNQRGFTLTEIMIVVAIIGFLSMIAVPSYRDHVRKARRVAAGAALVDAAQALERYMTRNGRYSDALPNTTCGVAPVDPAGGKYLLSCATSADGLTYLLQAVPQGSQVVAGDSCSVTLELRQTGARSPAECW